MIFRTSQYNNIDSKPLLIAITLPNTIPLIEALLASCAFRWPGRKFRPPPLPRGSASITSSTAVPSPVAALFLPGISESCVQAIPLHHTHSLLPGSSASPVFNRDPVSRPLKMQRSRTDGSSEKAFTLTVDFQPPGTYFNNGPTSFHPRSKARFHMAASLGKTLNCCRFIC